MAEYFVGTQGLGGQLKIWANIAEASRYNFLWCCLILQMFLVFFSSKIIEVIWDHSFPRSSGNEEVIF